jgi:RNA polymerase sigma-70 factor (ECF subfamily)
MADSSPLPDPAELLVHAAWLQRLARSLVRDDAAAEDLVQDTWLTALRSSPSEGLRPRPWLARVLRNRLRSLERSKTRRERREADVAPHELLPSTAALSERAESGRMLLDAVLGLPEAQRQVLLLSYFEGLSVARIAALTGTSEVAVRSRIARAVVTLREELDRRSGGDRAHWLQALVPLAQSRREAAFASTGALGAATFLGALTMTTVSKTLAGAAAILLLGLALREFVTHEPDGQADTASKSIGAVEVTDATSSEIANTTGVETIGAHAAPAIRTPQAPPPSAAPPEQATDRALAGRVVDARTGAPIAGARVLAQDIERVQDARYDADFAGTPATWQLETDSRGEFHKELEGASVVALEVTSSGYVPRKLPVVVLGPATEIELQPASRLVLEVRFDRTGDRTSLEPLAGATCRLVLDGGNHARRTIQEGTTDARGEVVFAPRGRMAHVIVEIPDQPSFVKIYELEAGQERIEVVLQPAGELTGRVVDKRSGQPIAGATLSETFREELRSITDSDGSFRIHDQGRLWTVSHPDYATVYQFIAPRSSGVDHAPDIELEASALIVGRIDGFEGTVQFTAVGKQSWFMYQRFRQSLSLDSPDSVRITGVPPRAELVLEARDGHGHIGILETRAAASGETVDFGTLVPTATAELHGQLAGLDPSLPAVVRVRIQRGELILRDLTHAAHGTEYRFTSLPPGEAEVWIEQEGTPGFVARLDLVAAETSLDLDMGGRIRGIVRDETGAGVGDAFFLVRFKRAGMGYEEGVRSDPTGRFVRAGLDRTGAHHVSLLRTDGPKCVAVPKFIEGVIPDGPDLEFTLYQNTATITGKVSDGILESNDADSLRVQGNYLSERVTATIRDDGTFLLSVPHSGPWTLQLLAIDESGETLEILHVNGVDDVRDARPGIPVEFRRE